MPRSMCQSPSDGEASWSSIGPRPASATARFGGHRVPLGLAARGRLRHAVEIARTLAQRKRRRLLRSHTHRARTRTPHSTPPTPAGRPTTRASRAARPRAAGRPRRRPADPTRSTAHLRRTRLGARVRVEGGVVTDARIALDSVGPTPLRAQSVEAALLGRPIHPGAANLGLRDVTPLDDIRSTAEHRRAVCVSTLRAFLSSVAPT